MSHRPVRRCVACRQSDARDALIRLVVAPDGAVVVDLGARLPGRGAWVHARSDCLEAVTSRRGVLDRALRQPVTGVDTIRAQLESALVRAMLDGLSQASAAGALVVGHDRLAEALTAGAVRILALASDAAPRTVSSLRRSCHDDVSVVELPFDRATLARATGQSLLAAVGVGTGGAARHLRWTLDLWSAPR